MGVSILSLAPSGARLGWYALGRFKVTFFFAGDTGSSSAITGYLDRGFFTDTDAREGDAGVATKGLDGGRGRWSDELS